MAGRNLDLIDPLTSAIEHTEADIRVLEQWLGTLSEQVGILDELTERIAGSTVIIPEILSLEDARSHLLAYRDALAAAKDAQICRLGHLLDGLEEAVGSSSTPLYSDPDLLCL